jgi:phospholipase/carboxylesterase
MIQAKNIKALEDFSSSKPSNLLFILFHGYGADAYDLFGLQDVIKSPSANTHWLFPQGVLSVPIGPGWMGRAWWNIDIAVLERAIQTGVDRNLSETKPEGLDSLRNALFEFIQAKGYQWDQVILGGFSQGAMLATELFLKCPESSPRALIILSGALINKREWESVNIPTGAPIFISHGHQDPILSYKEADRLESLFRAKNAKVTKVLFQGQHEIPPLVISKLNDFLAGLSHR